MKSLVVLAATIVCAALTSATVAAQGTAQKEIPVLHVRGNVYMLVGAAANAAVQAGNDGVLLVDTLTANEANAAMTAIRAISPRPVRWIINTHDHLEHTGGNAVIGDQGKFFVGNTRTDVGAHIVSHVDVLQAMSATSGNTAPHLRRGRPTPISQIRRTSSSTGKPSRFFMNRTLIRAVTASCSSAAPMSSARGTFSRRIDFRHRRRAGRQHQRPYRSVESHSSTHSSGGQPGRRHRWSFREAAISCDEADVAEYRDMVTIVRDRVQDMVKKGMTLEQVKAARPSRDYDPAFNRPDYTGDMFVEAVYRSLTAGGRR